MMKLLFKQRFLSWFDSYDIFDENGNTLYTVKGQLSWGHCFKIFDRNGGEVGMVKQRVFTWMPTFDIYSSTKKLGSIRRKFTFFRPKYEIDYCGWQVNGNFWEWNYAIDDMQGKRVADVSQKIWSWTDTYAIDVVSPEYALNALMLVIAIDAEKCSRNN